jgi:hypothetical protein
MNQNINRNVIVVKKKVLKHLQECILKKLNQNGNTYAIIAGILKTNQPHH